MSSLRGAGQRRRLETSCGVISLAGEPHNPGRTLRPALDRPVFKQRSMPQPRIQNRNMPSLYALLFFLFLRAATRPQTKSRPSGVRSGNSDGGPPASSPGRERSMKSIEFLINAAVHSNNEKGARRRSRWIPTSKTSTRLSFHRRRVRRRFSERSITSRIERKWYVCVCVCSESAQWSAYWLGHFLLAQAAVYKS